MADDESTPGAGAEQDGRDDASAESGGSFLSRFGGGFATIAGGVAAFVLMIVIGGFVAFQLLGGPGSGSAPGPAAADAPQSSQDDQGGGSGGSDGDGFADPSEPANPDAVIEPDDQDGLQQEQGATPSESAPADFRLRLSKAAAEPYENIVWRGSAQGSTGRTLMLQNKVGGSWVDYREDATVRGDGRYRGRFSVGAVGVNQFRAVEPRSGKVSNVVRVEIY